MKAIRSLEQHVDSLMSYDFTGLSMDDLMEQLEIVEWYRKVKFRKNLLGGVDEVQMWKKLEELYGLYENAIRAERARYNALLEAHTPPGENHEEGC